MKKTLLINRPRSACNRGVLDPESDEKGCQNTHDECDHQYGWNVVSHDVALQLRVGADCGGSVVDLGQGDA